MQPVNHPIAVRSAGPLSAVDENTCCRCLRNAWKFPVDYCNAEFDDEGHMLKRCDHCAQGHTYPKSPRLPRPLQQKRSSATRPAEPRRRPRFLLEGLRHLTATSGLRAKTMPRCFDDVYREWFPHRAQDKDVSEGSFFEKFMRFTSAAGTLREIVRFHAVLCEKLWELEREISDRKPVDHCAVRPGQSAQSAAEYKLREMFSAAFIVLDTGWQARSVLLVWRSEDLASRYNCEEGGEITGYDGSDGGDLGQSCVFRCPLKRAMQLIVSTDPERATRRAEYNEMVEEMLGEDDEGNNEQE